MDQAPDSFVLSLDDGIPYWPTMTAIAESEFSPGVLYAGTDDGQVQVTVNDGAEWQNVTSAMPGVPEMMWVNQVHASKSVDGRFYVAANNYRNDDYENYLWMSEDNGRSWSSIVGDLPPESVVRTVREDPRNPNVLYLGTEFGVFWSWNQGTNWVELTGNLPTVPVNDLVVHPRDNDLVLATHARGIWILDQINALQEFTPEIAASDGHLFSMEPAEQIRYRSEKAHTGNMIFEGENPPEGAIVDFWAGRGMSSADFSVANASGTVVAEFSADEVTMGMNRAIWDLRHTSIDGFGDPRSNGPWVMPGTYTVTMTAGGNSWSQTVEVREDPRLEHDTATRRAWTETLAEIWNTLGEARVLRDEVDALADRLDADTNRLDVSDALEAELRDRAREFGELQSRLSRLYGSTQGWVGPLSTDQAAQQQFLSEMLSTLRAEWRDLEGRLPG
jgi:hypothetical protein